MTTNDRIRAETALTALSALGFDSAKAGWRELAQKVDTWERGTPTADDLSLTVPVSAPPVGQHLASGQGDALPSVLTPSVMWKGYHYTLSPGQRRWFRDFAGMTPARTVTIDWLETWPGTQCPRSFKISSDVHVDPRHRAHVLVEWVVRDVVGFFRKSAEFDEEERVGKVVRLAEGELVRAWRGCHKRAVKELTGRVPIGDAEDMKVVSVSDDGWVVLTDFVGNRFEFDKEEFLGIVADIENGTAAAKPTQRMNATPKLAPTPKSLDEIMAALQNGILP